MTPQRILYLAPRIPRRPFDGGAHSIYHQLVQLRASGHHVTLGVPNTSRHRADASDAADLCDELITVNVDTSITAWGAFSALVGRGEPVQTDLPSCPYALRRFVSKELFEKISQAMSTKAPYDVIHVDYLAMAWYALAIKRELGAQAPPILLRSHNVEYRILEHTSRDRSHSLPRRLYYRLLARQTETYESAVAKMVDAVCTVSEVDADVYRSMAPLTPVSSITPGMDVPDLASLPGNTSGTPTIGMLGSLEWPPNVEGAIWFARTVLPRILEQQPGTVFHLAGRSPTPEVLALENGTSIRVHGPVESASEFLSSVDVVIAPVLSGSGVRIKILEGLAHARPMVTTTLGAEGLDVKPEEHLLMADTPDAFATACVRLATDVSLATRCAQNGRALVKREYSWQAATDKLLAVYASIRRSP